MIGKWVHCMPTMAAHNTYTLAAIKTETHDYFPANHTLQVYRTMVYASAHATLKALFSQEQKTHKNVGVVINNHLDGITILRILDFVILVVQMIQRKHVVEMEVTSVFSMTRANFRQTTKLSIPRSHHHRSQFKTLETTNTLAVTLKELVGAP